jgi:O-antigen/teichoic acid export membrane protein
VNESRSEAGGSESATHETSIPHRVLRSTATNVVGRVVVVGIGFLLTPFILHRVGAVDFGLWMLVESIVGYGALLDLGISAAVIKYVSENRARGDVAEASRLVTGALVLYLALGFAACCLAVAVAVLVPPHLGISSDRRSLASDLILLAGFRLAISIPGATPIAVLRAVNRFDLTNLLAVVSALIGAAGAVAVLLTGGGVLEVVAVGAITAAIMLVPAVWLARRSFPELRLTRAGLDWQLQRRILAFSSSVSVVQVGSRLQGKTDAIVIGLTLPVRAVTPFNLAVRLATVVTVAADQFAQIMLPLASETHVKEGPAGLRPLFLTSTRIIVALTLPLAVALAGLSDKVLSAWVGPEYAHYWYLVVILVVSALINVSTWPMASVAQSLERYKPFALLGLANGVINLALSFALVYPLGLVGVALGTLLPTLLETAVLQLWYLRRVLDVPPRLVVSDILRPLAAPAIATGAVVALLRWTVEPDSLWSLAAAFVVVWCVNALVYLRFGAGPLERATADEIFARVGLSRWLGRWGPVSSRGRAGD